MLARKTFLGNVDRIGQWEQPQPSTVEHGSLLRSASHQQNRFRTYGRSPCRCAADGVSGVLILVLFCCRH
jgi:hypothetical protein